MDGECLYTTKGRALAPLRRVVCGAYACAPYTGTCKRATFSTSHPIASPKRSLFFVFHLKTCPGRDHFSAVRVGAYGIRPTKWPRRGQECASAIDHSDHSPHKWVAGRAYAFALYTGACKRAAVRAYTRLRSPFLGTDSAYLYDSSPKRGICLKFIQIARIK